MIEADPEAKRDLMEYWMVTPRAFDIRGDIPEPGNSAWRPTYRTERTRGHNASIKYPWNELQVGECVFIPIQGYPKNALKNLSRFIKSSELSPNSFKRQISPDDGSLTVWRRF